ncbi:MAG: hypothetical protein KME15_22175 [Drouetiella hepatica Uher 2000/2452]|jgi:hypothetical protein|uniref:Uncharacterized protein n=1 Tax=Drouetiella hepatica Uher 2000/2452 TaxID=904376 RepID=A0A951QEY2_9CYAN|nr:hypothetical protein [Drouetiella hepatica Uher 2000/2452]
MTTLQTNQRISSPNPKPLCQIVGLACLTGFVLDILVMTFPLQLGNLAWRVGFLQQLGDRSIILLFGIALLIYGIIDLTAWRKRLAFSCLVLGAAFILSGIWVIWDSLALQKQTVAAISAQQQQIQTQINQAKVNPQLAAQITPEKLQQATQNIESQAESAKQNAQTGTLKTSFSGSGNLLVVGLALIGLGQYGIRPSRS